MNVFHNLIQEICKEQDINFSLLSKDWIIMLEKEGKTRFISGYKFDLNQHGFGCIMDDKYATFEILKKKNIPVIEHQILFNKKNQNAYAKNANNYKNVEQFFDSNNKDIVLKGNNGTCGNEVYHLTKKKDISPTLEQVFKRNFSISLCPFYKIKAEYRLIMLNKECLVMYGKKRPIVVGNGRKTVEELLIEFNPSFFKDKLKEPVFKQILKANETYEYSWQFNLSKGAIPFAIEDESLKEKLLNIAKKIASLLPIGFCSIDIIETEKKELLVMELNSGVMMKNYIEFCPNGYNIAKKVYEEAILDMFK